MRVKAALKVLKDIRSAENKSLMLMQGSNKFIKK